MKCLEWNLENQPLITQTQFELYWCQYCQTLHMIEKSTHVGTGTDLSFTLTWYWYSLVELLDILEKASVGFVCSAWGLNDNHYNQTTNSLCNLRKMNIVNVVVCRLADAFHLASWTVSLDRSCVKWRCSRIGISVTLNLGCFLPGKRDKIKNNQQIKETEKKVITLFNS